MNNKRYGWPNLAGRVIEVGTGVDITDLFRQIMINKAYENGQGLSFNAETETARRVDYADMPDHGTLSQTTQITPQPMQEADPVMA